MFSRCFSTSSRNYSAPRVVQVLSLDARDTLIRAKENPAVVYSRFASEKGLHVDPDSVFTNFLKNYKRMSTSSPCFGFKDGGEKVWWKEVVVSTLLDCSPKLPKSEVQSVAEDLFAFYATVEPWELVEDNVMDLFRKPKKRNVPAQVVRKRSSSSEDETEVKDIVKRRRRLNPMVQSTKKSEQRSKRSSDDSEESDDTEVAVATHSFASTGESGPAGPRDQGATATLEVDTDYTRDAQAQFERVQQQLKDGIQTDDGKVLYKGAALYGAKVAQDTAKGNASSGYNRVGPVRAPQFLRQTVRWDFAPDICKDYKETGFCTFGDSCKFVHDRSDYKHGWEIDEEYEAGKYGVDDDTNYEIHEDDEKFPELCFVCGNNFVDPIVTKCKHYLCGGCALKAFQKTSKCPICGQNTEKIMNAARDLISYLKKKAQSNQQQEAKDSDDEQPADHSHDHTSCEGHNHPEQEEHEQPEEQDDKKDDSDGEQEIVMEEVEGLEGGENGEESDDEEESDG